MRILVVVSGSVPSRKRDEFEAAYAVLKEEPLPIGLIRSNLTCSTENPSFYEVISIWNCRQALKRYLSKAKAMRAERLFRSVGAKPRRVVLEIIDMIP